MKFIHLADVHLGAAPDRGYSWSQAREEEIWETFRRVIAGIRENPVDLLFIAGDLFHRQPLMRELKEVNYLFSTIPETRIYLMAGNHDYMKKGSAYLKFDWAPNVVLFRTEEMQCIRDEKLDVYVYGLSYLHQEITAPLYDAAVPEKEDGIHILLAHGGDEKHIPIRFGRLLAAGFDYIALGHIHKPQLLGKGKGAYPGALEPIDRNDVGTHGYVEGWTEDGQLHTRFVPVASRCYYDLELSLGESSTQMSLEEAVREEIRKRGAQHIYRIILRGRRAPELMLLPERLKNLGNVTEVVDCSVISYDLEELYRRYSGTLIGDYIAYFLRGDMGDVEQKALFYGLQALLETSHS